MTWKEKVLFLDAKRQLIAPHLAGDSALNYEMMFSHILACIDAIDEAIPNSALKDLDTSLEKSMAGRIAKLDEERIRSDLVKIFGFSSLGKQPSVSGNVIRDTPPTVAGIAVKHRAKAFCRPGNVAPAG